MVSRRGNIWILLLVVFLSLFLCGCACSKPSGIPVTVANVVDGDTIKVFYKGKKQLVRLTGIDTPEERFNEKAERDAGSYGIDMNVMIIMGKMATRFTRGIVKKRDTVYLEFDVKRKDEYGRLLAYVWLSDGRMMNELILAEGYGRAYSIPPNLKYRQKFITAQRQAKEKGKGLWK